MKSQTNSQGQTGEFMNPWQLTDRRSTEVQSILVPGKSKP